MKRLEVKQNLHWEFPVVSLSEEGFFSFLSQKTVEFRKWNLQCHALQIHQSQIRKLKHLQAKIYEIQLET